MEIRNTKNNRGDWFYKIATGWQEENYLELTIPNPYNSKLFSSILHTAKINLTCGIYGYTTEAGGEYVESIGIDWNEITAISGTKKALDLFADWLENKDFQRVNDETFYKGGVINGATR